MKLEDLLVSYKAVMPLEERTQTEETISPYDRLRQYRASIQQEFNNPQLSTSQSEEYVFPGWKEVVQSVYRFPEQREIIQSVYRKPTPTEFTQQFDSYLKNHPQDADTRDILTSIARLESNFNPSAKNPDSSALGYFQFLDRTRKEYDSSTRQEFANDPSKQFAAAVKYYRKLKKQLTPYETVYKSKGLTPLQAMYGMWWRPASFINYLKKGKDDYVNPSDGMTIEQILERAKNG